VSRDAKRIELECGIPAIGVAASNIVKYATGYDFEFNNGMPIRFVSCPFPFAGQPKSVDREYVEGKDLVTGKPMMTAVADAFTKPLTAREQIKGMPPGAVAEPRMLAADSEDNLHRLFKDKEWTDYNPIILPTEERVAQMLKGTSHKPDEVIKTINITGGARPLTVEKAAVYAVMAGAKPEYFPVILAMATQAPFGNSTTSMANMIVVNGPACKRLGLNCGTNAMGPYNEANSVIGRAFTLMSKTAGDLRNNVVAWESLGNNLQYNNVFFAENEAELPEGWDPLHVQMGFKPTDSVVTVGVGWSYISSLGESQQPYGPHMLMRDYMRALAAMGSAATIVMDPTVATLLKNVYGFKTKAQLSEWFSQNVEKTVASYWGNGVIATTNTAFALQGLEPYATWRNLPGETLIKPFNNAKAIQVVVTGGKVQTTWFVTDFRMGRGVLVDNWM
jgi:hypothetical protein